MPTQRQVAGGAVGLILIPLGALTFWGGLTGNLAAILAALFAPDQLRDRSSGQSPFTSASLPGKGQPTQTVETPQSFAGDLPSGALLPQLEQDIAQGTVVPNVPLPPAAQPGTAVVKAPWWDTALHDVQNALRDINGTPAVGSGAAPSTPGLNPAGVPELPPVAP